VNLMCGESFIIPSLSLSDACFKVHSDRPGYCKVTLRVSQVIGVKIHQ